MSAPVAIVTGGRRGIGLGIASALAAAGFDIAVVDLAPEAEAEKALAELRACGCRAVYHRCDLADTASHEGVVAAIVAELGPVSCLVNNAGMASVVRGDFLELKPENFDRIVAVNLRGTIFFTQAVARAMLEKPGAHPASIVTISSVSAEMASPERVDYCVTKAGLAAFVKGLALRLAEAGIAVFEVRPGIIRTDMTAAVTEKYDRLIEGGLVPQKRWGEPADVGAICAALATGGFAFATGSVIAADGGLSIARL
jgi:Dehydrogenases with different specificities (related to short-chain alcohol dehydrogenases)